MCIRDRSFTFEASSENTDARNDSRQSAPPHLRTMLRCCPRRSAVGRQSVTALRQAVLGGVQELPASARQPLSIAQDR
eukprot:12501688-Alexandrium_andersonii.AAC.1